jgi:hypothetical protein
MHTKLTTASAALAALLALTVLVMAATPAQGSGYTRDWEAKGSTFFDKFNFMTHDDYSLGFVNYANRTYAQGMSSLPLSLSLSLAISHACVRARDLVLCVHSIQGSCAVVYQQQRASSRWHPMVR